MKAEGAGHEMEVCVLLWECYSQESTYVPYYALLAQQLSAVNMDFQRNFEACFVRPYAAAVHWLEENKLCNLANLLSTYDALPWRALASIRLTEDNTTSSSQIFIKFLFEELALQLGTHGLSDRLISDPSMQDSFIFSKDNPKNTRLAINFFTAIGLGGIAENLRTHFLLKKKKNMQKKRTCFL